MNALLDDAHGHDEAHENQNNKTTKHGTTKRNTKNYDATEYFS